VRIRFPIVRKGPPGDSAIPAALDTLRRGGCDDGQEETPGPRVLL
ncbi:MAG: hypothetical protein AVDCRST_MAG89-3469, partial [uncultured Gemmatimonadetes bacterium]